MQFERKWNIVAMQIFEQTKFSNAERSLPEIIEKLATLKTTKKNFCAVE